MIKITIAASLLFQTSKALENGLARTPPMGWLSWQRFGCDTDCQHHPDICISKQLYQEIAEALVSTGLRDAGYVYLNIDDCWSEKTVDSNGYIMPDHIRFPPPEGSTEPDGGIKELSKYVHDRKLKFGLYADIGTKTCQLDPGLAAADGSLGEQMLKAVEKFVEWEVDSLKVDGCNSNIAQMHTTYAQLGEALKQSKRPILYSCSWPAYVKGHLLNNRPELHILAETCNLWRNYGDIDDSEASVRSILEYWAQPKNSPLVQVAGPGHWNDPDMLNVGNPGLSISQQKAQFAIWAVIAAPLYISADIRNISDEALDILKNQKIIQVNQDPLGKQGYVVHDKADRRIWVRELADRNGFITRAVVFENKRTAFNRIDFLLDVNQISDGVQVRRFSVDNVYSEDDPKNGEYEGHMFTVDVDESCVKMYIFTILDPLRPNDVSIAPHTQQV